MNMSTGIDRATGRPARRVRIGGVITMVLAAALLLALQHSRPALARGDGHVAAAKKASGETKSAFTVAVANTDFGATGAKGHFSAKLGRSGHVLAAVLTAATKVPIADIARGGSYVAKDDSNGKGGMVVARFTDHALGEACVTFTAKHGPYNTGKGYVPVSGTMTLVGGTKQAAHWRGTITFKQTGVTGEDTLDFAGSAIAKVEGKHGFSAACKAVAKL